MIADKDNNGSQTSNVPTNSTQSVESTQKRLRELNDIVLTQKNINKSLEELIQKSNSLKMEELVADMVPRKMCMFRVWLFFLEVYINGKNKLNK